jgi:multicomponent Na+:H+ antiporter subunit A
VTYALGTLLFLVRRPLARVLAAGEVVPSGTEVYLRTLRALNRIAIRTTSIVQNGSLPIYAGVILMTAAALPGVVLLTRTDWPGWPQLAGSPAQWPIVAILLGAAFAASVTRRRFSAALFLGTAGYAMAALFVVQSAPDLALTQAAIETLTTVIFVLVLRRLPDRFERRSTPMTRTLRIAISVSVAVFVFAFAVIARGSRTAEPVSTQMIEQSLSEGKGRNVVNVILVDFRGFDTLGEITVLAAAAIGAVALARVGRRSPPARKAAGE